MRIQPLRCRPILGMNRAATSHIRLPLAFVVKASGFRLSQSKCDWGNSRQTTQHRVSMGLKLEEMLLGRCCAGCAGSQGSRALLPGSNGN
jgi:hypothetical protein